MAALVSAAFSSGGFLLLLASLAWRDVLKIGKMVLRTEHRLGISTLQVSLTSFYWR